MSGALVANFAKGTRPGAEAFLVPGTATLPALTPVPDAVIMFCPYPGTENGIESVINYKFECHNSTPAVQSA